jgi:hypothetical protein
MPFPLPGPVHPELVEGRVAKPFMLREPQHERLIFQRPFNYGLIGKGPQLYASVMKIKLGTVRTYAP